MNYQFRAKTDPGKLRENNEDAVVFDEATSLAILADGMGGYNAGEIASGMATAFIKSEMSRWLIEAGESAKLKEVRRAMEICVENANMAIYNSANSNTQYAGMGTTLVMGVLRDDKLLLGHIGDSRCYRYRAGMLEAITKDHSLLQEQIDAGLISQQEAANSNIKNLVTRALGVEEFVSLDINEHEVQLGDIYLMCSDGLSDMVDDASIAQILSTNAPLDHLANSLVGLANENGGRDNISVLLIFAGESPERRGILARLLGK